MIGIIEGDGKRVTKNGGRLLERDFVVTQVRGSLLRIPRKLHLLILRGDLASRTSTDLVERPGTMIVPRKDAAHDASR